MDTSTYGNMQTHFDGVAGPLPTCCSCCSTCPAPPPWGLWCERPVASGPRSPPPGATTSPSCAPPFYQLATFAAHPAQSLVWSLSYLLSLVLLWWLGRRHGDIVARKVVTL